MTQRVTANTTPEGTSASWTPAGTADIIIQVANSGDMINLNCQIETQLNSSAPWVAVINWRPLGEPLVQLSHLPKVRVSWRGNVGSLDIWDAE